MLGVRGTLLALLSDAHPLLRDCYQPKALQVIPGERSSGGGAAPCRRQRALDGRGRRVLNADVSLLLCPHSGAGAGVGHRHKSVPAPAQALVEDVSGLAPSYIGVCQHNNGAFTRAHCILQVAEGLRVPCLGGGAKHKHLR
jgi:hypothetical protein